MRADRERLLDIKEAIEAIEKYSLENQTDFEENELIQVWVVHHLRIIGEACRALSNNLKKKYSNVPWSKIIGMRNILVHAYFRVDAEIAWSVLVNDLPDLKRQIELMLNE